MIPVGGPEAVWCTDGEGPACRGAIQGGRATQAGGFRERFSVAIVLARSTRHRRKLVAPWGKPAVERLQKTPTNAMKPPCSRCCLNCLTADAAWENRGKMARIVGPLPHRTVPMLPSSSSSLFNR